MYKNACIESLMNSTNFQTTTNTNTLYYIHIFLQLDIQHFQELE